MMFDAQRVVRKKNLLTVLMLNCIDSCWIPGCISLTASYLPQVLAIEVRSLSCSLCPFLWFAAIKYIAWLIMLYIMYGQKLTHYAMITRWTSYWKGVVNFNEWTESWLIQGRLLLKVSFIVPRKQFSVTQWRTLATKISSNIGSGNGLLSDGTWTNFGIIGKVQVIWLEFHKQYLTHQSLNLFWKLLKQNFIRTSLWRQGAKGYIEYWFETGQRCKIKPHLHQQIL